MTPITDVGGGGSATMQIKKLQRIHRNWKMCLMTLPYDPTLVQEVGVSADELNTWVDEFKIPGPDKYRKNAVQVLKMIKDLKDKDCGFQTIQRKIQLDYPELEEDNSYDSFESPVPAAPEYATYVDELREEFLKVGELTEKYAQANYTIGQMTMRMQQLEDENQRLKKQLKLLPSPEQYANMEESEHMHKNLLRGMQQRLVDLENQLREARGGKTQPPPRMMKLPSLPDLPAPLVHKKQLSLPFEDNTSV